MRIPRIFVDRPLADGTEVTLDAAAARHLVRVLRRKPGEPVVVFGGDGREWPGEVLRTGEPDGCAVRLGSARHPETESPLAITLVQAIGRGERTDWCIQKAVELGVHAIRPILTERTEVRLDPGRADKRRRRWHDIAVSACEQSGRTRIPEIATPCRLTELRPGEGMRLMLDPDGSLSPGGLAAPGSGAICLAVGPEGGFSPAEGRWLAEQDFAGLRLGPRILRTETAGPVAIAVLQARFGDLG